MSNLFDELTESANQDGSIEINKGKIIVTDPQNYGRFPTISPGNGVDVFVNGNKIDKTTAVSEKDKIEVVLNKQGEDIDFDVEITKDGLEAYLNIKNPVKKNYSIQDHPPTTDLVVHIREYESKELTEEDINFELLKNNIIFGVDKNAIKDIVKNKKKGRYLIAKGLPPSPPRDAYIEYLFNNKQDLLSRYNSEEKINFKELNQIPSVEVGEVLAVKHPAKLGDKGIDVRGNFIEPELPKDVTIKVKDGVKVTEDGTKAIAMISGRPVLEGHKVKYLSVVPVYVHNGNVDLSSGNIRFDGDVIITGNITEGMSVVSKGNVVVYGDAVGSVIHARGCVKVKKVISSKIFAGENYSFYYKLAKNLGKLEKLIFKLFEAAEAVMKHPEYQKISNKKEVIGILVKKLLESKFPDITNIIEEINCNTKEVEFNIDKDLNRLIKERLIKLQGLNPLKIKSLQEIMDLKQDVQFFAEKLSEIPTNLSDITAAYVQNSLLRADGTVEVLSNVYHSKIIGQKVKVAGFFRGGEVFAKNTLIIKEAGSKTAVKTLLEVEKGLLRVDLVYPNTILKVGDFNKKVVKEEYYVVIS